MNDPTLFDAPAAPTSISAFSGKPVARRSDPQTSWEAAQSVDPSPSERLVLRALRVLRIATDEQIADCIAKQGRKDTPQRLRTARNTLAKARLVTHVDDKGVTERGRRAARWALTGAGRDTANNIARDARAQEAA